MLDIFVFRFNQSGNFAESEPCSECLKALYKTRRIRRIWFSTTGGAIKCCKLEDMYMAKIVHKTEKAYVSSGWKNLRGS